NPSRQAAATLPARRLRLRWRNPVSGTPPSADGAGSLRSARPEGVGRSLSHSDAVLRHVYDDQPKTFVTGNYHASPNEKPRFLRPRFIGCHSEPQRGRPEVRVAPAVVELAHLRASQINGCSACIDYGVKQA